jgi:glycosyltransferase involved in cell wall biosynthesis
MKRLTLVCPVNSFTGYGQHAIQYARWIEKLTGAYVSIRAINVCEAFGATIPPDIRARIVTGVQPEEFELLIHPPHKFCPTAGKKTIWYTLWESTQLPPTGAMLLNRAECVVTASAWNASTFSSCGVERSIRVVPLGADPALFNWRPIPEELNGLTVFGTAGRMAHGGVRKGINETIKLFQKAFPDESDVRLKVKCFDDCPVEKPEDDRITITQGYLSEQAMADWFAGIHVFVSAAKAEGWGLMQQEAMMMGRPVVSIDFGGVCEFFDESAGYAIPWQFGPAQGAYFGCGHWANPDPLAIIMAMRRIRIDLGGAEVKGAAAHHRVRHLTWENSAQKMVEVLEQLRAL